MGGWEGGWVGGVGVSKARLLLMKLENIGLGFLRSTNAVLTTIKKRESPKAP